MFVPPWAKVSYVDRMKVTDLLEQYPELRGKNLVSVDIVDDGERLEQISNDSQDFVIANHFLEHCENPIFALENMLRVLRNGGIIFLALPDMRYSFDKDRPVTSLEHILRDYREGPNISRLEHYKEWVRFVDKITDVKKEALKVDQLLEKGYSIHFHAWTQREMLELVKNLQDHFPCDLELMLINKGEVIFLIRKAAS